MAGKISLYGSITAIVAAYLIAIGIQEGFSVLFYTILIFAFAILIIYLMGKFVPKLWNIVIFSSLITIGMYFLTKLWSVAILYACFCIFMFIVDYKIKSKKWSRVVITVIWAMFISILMFIVLKEDFGEQSPEITEKDTNAAVSEMKNNDKVIEAGINVKNNTIYSGLKVDESVSKRDKKKLGEELTEILDSQVEKDNKSKELYDYYSLSISVGTNGDDDSILGGIDINSEDKSITWDIYEKQLSD